MLDFCRFPGIQVVRLQGLRYCQYWYVLMIRWRHLVVWNPNGNIQLFVKGAWYVRDISQPNCALLQQVKVQRSDHEVKKLISMAYWFVSDKWKWQPDASGQTPEVVGSNSGGDLAEELTKKQRPNIGLCFESSKRKNFPHNKYDDISFPITTLQASNCLSKTVWNHIWWHKLTKHQSRIC